MGNIHNWPQQHAVCGLWSDTTTNGHLQSDDPNVGCARPLKGFAMHSTVRLGTENPPLCTFSELAPGNREARSCPISSSSVHPTPTHPGVASGCRNVMVSWQTDSLFPGETGPPLGGLLLCRLGHSKHKGLSSLSATLSSNGDSLPAGEPGRR